MKEEHLREANLILLCKEQRQDQLKPVTIPLSNGTHIKRNITVLKM